LIDVRNITFNNKPTIVLYSVPVHSKAAVKGILIKPMVPKPAQNLNTKKAL